jgi:hypothetical protein
LEMIFTGQTGVGLCGQTKTELEVKQSVFSTYLMRPHPQRSLKLLR